MTFQKKILCISISSKGVKPGLQGNYEVKTEIENESKSLVYSLMFPSHFIPNLKWPFISCRILTVAKNWHKYLQCRLGPGHRQTVVFVWDAC